MLSRRNHTIHPALDPYEFNSTIRKWPIGEIARWDFRQLLLHIYMEGDPRYLNAENTSTQQLELEYGLTHQTESKEEEEEEEEEKKETEPPSLHLPPHAYDSNEEYLQSFHPWIYEEARALITEGLQNPPLGSYELRSRSTRQSRWHNFTEIIFCDPIQLNIINKLGASDLVVQLENSQTGETTLGIAAQQYDRNNQAGHIIRISSIHEIGNNNHWIITPLGSIATLRLTYSGLCQLEHSLNQQQDHLSPQTEHKVEPLEGDTKREELPQQLNEKQQEFVDYATQIVSHPKSTGLEPILLEGPPGTGKTTTVLAFLDAIPEKRVLVCAPSNSAVALLALRYYRMHPTEKIILLGQHDKLINDTNRELEDIFLDNCLKKIHSTAVAAIAILNDFIPTEGTLDEEDLSHKIQELRGYYENLLQQLKRFNPDNIHCTREKSIIELLENIELDKSNALCKYYAKNNSYLSENGNPIAIIISKLGSMFSTCNTLEDANLINNADMIFCTLTTTASRLKAMKDVDVVVIDEAGQATEAQSLLPLIFRPKVLVEAGDIHQLEATVSSRNLNDINKSGYQGSMMTRLRHEGLPFFILTIQYRMHEDICALPSMLYYDGLLTPCEEITSGQREAPYPNSEVLVPYCFVDITRGHETQQKKGQPHIRENLTEAYYIARFMYHLKHNLGISLTDNVCIITFYNDQVLAIQSALKGQEITEVIDIATVDSFQGGERNIVILSCVRSNEEGNLGFLANEHRLNVAITRARHALWIFGNVSTLQDGTSSVSTREDGLTDFHDLINDAYERDCLITNSALDQLIRAHTPDHKNRKLSKNQQDDNKVSSLHIPSKKHEKKQRKKVYTSKNKEPQKKIKRKKGKKSNNDSRLFQTAELHPPSQKKAYTSNNEEPQKIIKRKKRKNKNSELFKSTTFFPPPGLAPPPQGLSPQPGLVPPTQKTHTNSHDNIPPPPGLAPPPHAASQKMVGPPPGLENPRHWHK